MNNNIFLLGNPNCGKTSLFNAITGKRLHVGNWPGVTVQKIEGFTTTPNGNLTITDLPGTYSLTPATPEEKVVLDALNETTKGRILNVVDISNFERNLLLTAQLTELGIKPIISFNCYDLFINNGGKVDLEKFEQLTGLIAYPTVARKKEGIQSLIEGLTKNVGLENKTKSILDMPQEWKDAMIQAADIKGVVWEQMPPLEKYQLIEEFIAPVDKTGNEEFDKLRNSLAETLSKKQNKTIHTHDLSCELTTNRYSRIQKLLSSCAVVPEKNLPKWQQVLDKVLTDKYVGFPILFLMLVLVFWTTFTIGQYPMDWLDAGVEWFKKFVESKMSEGLFRSLLVDGIISGVGSVIVFLPNILILFLWISLLEDSGYMSRAAFMFDRLMTRIGLQGRSFIPMIMGLGCNVPAIMATRIIDSKMQRLLTIMLIPLVICSARLPVMTMLCGTFFTENQAYWMALLFLVNFAIIIFLGHMISIMYKTVENSPFLIEMPPYRLPTFKSTMDMLKEKSLHFIVKAGTIILAGTIIIWVLSNFPQKVDISDKLDVAAEKAKIESTINNEEEKEAALENLKQRKESFEMEKRYIGQLGNMILPIFKPLGFTWRESVSLVPGFLAKESVVSTLAVLYSPFFDKEDENTKKEAKDEDEEKGRKAGAAMRKCGMTNVQAFVFMVFTLLYIPCLATFGIMQKESGSWKFTIASLIAYFIIAYAVAYISLLVGNALIAEQGWQTITIALIAIISVWYLLHVSIVSIRGKICHTCSSCGSCCEKEGKCCHKCDN